MKPITLQDFHAEVKKLAVKKHKAACQTEVKLWDYNGEQQITFRCYVSDYAFYEGSTPAEALAKLRAAMFPVKRVIPEIIIETI